MKPVTVAPSSVDFPVGGPFLAKLLGSKFALRYRIVCPSGMKPAAITVDRKQLRMEVDEALKACQERLRKLHPRSSEAKHLLRLKVKHQALIDRIGSPWFADVRGQEARISESGGESFVEVRIQTRTFLNPCAMDFVGRLRLSYVPVPSADPRLPAFLCERRQALLLR